MHDACHNRTHLRSPATSAKWRTREGNCEGARVRSSSSSEAWAGSFFATAEKNAHTARCVRENPEMPGGSFGFAPFDAQGEQDPAPHTVAERGRPFVALPFRVASFFLVKVKRKMPG